MAVHSITVSKRSMCVGKVRAQKCGMSVCGGCARFVTIKGNDQIRQFIWEYAGIVQELLAHIKESGATVLGTKMVLATL